MSLLSSPQFLRAVVWFDALTGILPGSLHLLMANNPVFLIARE